MVDAVGLPRTSGSGVTRGTGNAWRDSAGLEISGSRGATENIPYWRGSPIRVRCRSSWGEPMRDRSRARRSAVIGRKGDGKESVRCHNGPSHGPSYHQHRVPGIWGAVGGSLGDGERVALPQMRHMQSGPPGVGLGFIQGGWEGISRASGIASWVPACSLWSAIAGPASKPERATRGMEMPNPYIAHSGAAEDARVHEKGTYSAI